MVAFISALRLKPSRVMPASRRPTRLAGTMNTGSSSSDRTDNRHSNTTMAPMVVARVTTLETTVPNVPVTALWAPITSLFSRLTRAPVWVRVKKAIGWR